ncbi:MULTISPECIES: hypothetical protein [Cryobacterium]|uniref:hypothetical protein n=1 Tax=Cryobacterium TaxID=69578 RepID=UPI000CD42A1B|nr:MULTISPECIES: hypothetical protein [Cryobacterium]POH63640.1 hypothetical protein C3B60_16125 [Cryobacterium zongtaii]TFC45571.1 hypothetical protein E3O57_07960 [Cryobacterium sp. TMN-39-2]
MRTDNLTIPQGTTWAMRWPLQEEGGTAFDLDGWDARAQARATVMATGVLHSWTSAEGNIVLDGLGVLLTVDPAVSSAWAWQSAVYDIEIFHTDGTVIRITQGGIKVSPEVTR